jgi:hypothetical protein
MTGSHERGRRQPQVDVLFDHAERRYLPHDRLAVRYEISGLGQERVRAVEHSVVWYTEGKGEEDLGVHHFQRITDEASLPPAIMVGSFSVDLPASPLSYEGVIVKIRWCVRVRLFFFGGRDFVSEHVFEVGVIPPARRVSGQAAAEAEAR